MLKLDPVAALVWRTPTTLQIGVDPPLAVLPDLPPTAERLLAALVAGTDRPSLGALALERGIAGAELDRLLQALAPALGTPAEAPPAPVLVEGPPDLVRTLGVADGLIAAGAGATPAARPALVVLAAHHALAPGRAARWLGRDVPHLPVVFGERAAALGPLVTPGTAPCLRCADEHRIDDDPAWPAIAAQLLRLAPAPAAGAAALRIELAARLAAVLRAVRAGEATGLAGWALRIAADGSVSRLARPWHARCSCRFPAPAA